MRLGAVLWGGLILVPAVLGRAVLLAAARAGPRRGLGEHRVDGFCRHARILLVVEHAEGAEARNVNIRPLVELLIALLVDHLVAHQVDDVVAGPVPLVVVPPHLADRVQEGDVPPLMKHYEAQLLQGEPHRPERIDPDVVHAVGGGESRQAGDQPDLHGHEDRSPEGVLDDHLAPYDLDALLLVRDDLLDTHLLDLGGGEAGGDACHARVSLSWGIMGGPAPPGGGTDPGVC